MRVPCSSPAKLFSSAPVTLKFSSEFILGCPPRESCRKVSFLTAVKGLLEGACPAQRLSLPLFYANSTGRQPLTPQPVRSRMCLGCRVGLPCEAFPVHTGDLVRGPASRSMRLKLRR